MSATALTLWRPLTKGDLTTFDDFMTGIVMEYTSLGWLGKMSTKGHAVLRAPDGVTTTSVSRSSNRGSSGTRARAELDRWKNNQPGAAFGISPTGMDAAADVHLNGILARAANDPRARKYIADLVDAGVDPDEMHARVAVIGNEAQGGDWVLMDTITRKVFAWSKDLSEDEAHVIAYGMLGLQDEPEPVFRCPDCLEVFPSGKALGGHRNSHKPRATCAVVGCAWEGAYIEAHMKRKHPHWLEMPEAEVPAETDPVEALVAADPTVTPLSHFFPEPASDPSATLDPLGAVQALVAEVQEFRVRAADFLALGDEVAALRKELAATTQQRDDLQARLDLLRETLAL